jgi:predicted transcriptional regulator
MSMLARCRNPGAPNFHKYGGAGVKVCAEWQESFTAFLDHVGPRPDGTTLDRIESSRGYEPGNVRWATLQEQNRNRRSVIWIEIDGQRRCLAEWAQISGITEHCIRYRMRVGVIGVALIAPAHHGKRLDEKYYDTARRRCEDTREQASLFATLAPKAEQLALIGKQ